MLRRQLHHEWRAAVPIQASTGRNASQEIPTLPTLRSTPVSPCLPTWPPTKKGMAERWVLRIPTKGEVRFPAAFPKIQSDNLACLPLWRFASACLRCSPKHDGGYPRRRDRVTQVMMLLREVRGSGGMKEKDDDDGSPALSGLSSAPPLLFCDCRCNTALLKVWGRPGGFG